MNTHAHTHDTCKTHTHHVQHTQHIHEGNECQGIHPQLPLPLSRNPVRKQVQDPFSKGGGVHWTPIFTKDRALKAQKLLLLSGQ